MSKQCSKCKEIKLYEQFIKRSRAKDGLTSECKECHKLISKLWESHNKPKRYINKRNHEIKNPEKTKNNKYKRQYGITLDDYNKLLDTQNGCCAICKRHKSEFSMALHTDHNHATGKVRGILCQKCNRGLGFFNDDTELMKEAINYLIS